MGRFRSITIICLHALALQRVHKTQRRITHFLLMQLNFLQPKIFHVPSFKRTTSLRKNTVLIV